MHKAFPHEQVLVSKGESFNFFLYTLSLYRNDSRKEFGTSAAQTGEDNKMIGARISFLFLLIFCVTSRVVSLMAELQKGGG